MVLVSLHINLHTRGVAAFVQALAASFLQVNTHTSGQVCKIIIAFLHDHHLVHVLVVWQYLEMERDKWSILYCTMHQVVSSIKIIYPCLKDTEAMSRGQPPDQLVRQKVLAFIRAPLLRAALPPLQKKELRPWQIRP